MVIVISVLETWILFISCNRVQNYFFFYNCEALRTIDRLWLFFLLVRWSHKEGHCVMSGPFITDYLVWVLLLVESRTVSRWPIVAYTYVILYLAHCCFIGNHSHTISFYFHIENWIFFLTTIVTSGRINALCSSLCKAWVGNWFNKGMFILLKYSGKLFKTHCQFIFIIIKGCSVIVNQTFKSITYQIFQVSILRLSFPIKWLIQILKEGDLLLGSKITKTSFPLD